MQVYALPEYVATFKRTYSIKKYVILIVLHAHVKKWEGLVGAMGVIRRNENYLFL